MTSGMSKNGLPNNIQVELVEGCNRMCAFCGIYSIWKEKQDRIVHFMDFDLAKQVAAGLSSWKGFEKKRIEFAMHGEPTLHPKHTDIITVFRKSLPYAQLQFTTNGILLHQWGSDYVKKLFQSGVNILVVDTYSNREEINKALVGSGIRISSYYGDGSVNPYHYHGPDLQVIVVMDDLGKRSGSRAARKILNHAGNSNQKVLLRLGIPPINAPLTKKCSRPFREITIHYDGTVPICCTDWRHECLLGKFPDSGSFQDIWNSDGFQSARALLGNGLREGIVPCARCDYNGGFRLGLLPKPPRISEQDALDHINSYAARFKKYRHKNADSLEKSENKGITRFL